MEKKNQVQSPLQVEEGNRLIDAFAPEVTKKMQWGRPKHIVEHEGLQYHSSWDWLMPVVEKIRDDKEFGSIDITINYLFNLNNQLSMNGFNSVGELWAVVVNFLKRNKSKNS